MKLKLIILLSFVTASFAADPFFPAYAEQLRINQVRTLEASLYLDAYYQRQRLERHERMNQIITAYPDNPQLYRYLERNPRYINFYLGK